jgi:hypothetical protein
VRAIVIEVGESTYEPQTYEPDEWTFPESELLDGVIEGAMRAGLEGYTA